MAWIPTATARRTSATPAAAASRTRRTARTPPGFVDDRLAHPQHPFRLHRRPSCPPAAPLPASSTPSLPSSPGPSPPLRPPPPLRALPPSPPPRSLLPQLHPLLTLAISIDDPSATAWTSPTPSPSPPPTRRTPSGFVDGRAHPPHPFRLRRRPLSPALLALTAATPWGVIRGPRPRDLLPARLGVPPRRPALRPPCRRGAHGAEAGDGGLLSWSTVWKIVEYAMCYGVRVVPEFDAPVSRPLRRPPPPIAGNPSSAPTRLAISSVDPLLVAISLLVVRPRQ